MKLTMWRIVLVLNTHTKVSSGKLTLSSSVLGRENETLHQVMAKEGCTASFVLFLRVLLGFASRELNLEINCSTSI